MLLPKVTYILFRSAYTTNLIIGGEVTIGQSKMYPFRSGEVALNLKTRTPIKNAVVGSRDTAKYLGQLLVPVVQLTHCGK